MRAMKKILVTGGTGIAGRALIRALLARGCSIRVLSRSGRLSPDIVCSNVVSVRGDIRDKSVVMDALEGVDTVFHLAARISGSSGKQGTDDGFHSVNVVGTRILAEASEAAGVERLVFYSSISVYGHGPGNAPKDETSPPDPDSEYSRSKVLAEKLILAARNRNGKPMGVVLRVASVYGPPEKQNYSRLIRMIRSGLCISFAPGVKRTLVHDSDLAQAAILAAESPSAAGEVFNVTDGSIHTMESITRAIGAALGRPFVCLAVPGFLMRILHRIILKEPLYFSFLSVIRNQVEKMTLDTAVLGEKSQSQLCFRPGTDLEKGWQDAVSRYQQKG